MSPISKYFAGHGTKVMNNMKTEYGDKKGKQIFYATSNKRKKKNSMAPSKDLMNSIGAKE